ncbi:hypothetical protein H5410_049873 [Solanum commersonii]|uniref:Uncharacterized protein n=1 Tax=Solanum commersonii TaxID=4109 RepID=A0A9J5WWB6_SOLCO|nr:hypothetical protein H5410_049873 [Solanum commersonii]
MDSFVATKDSFVATEDEMIQAVSSMTTTQSFIDVAFSSNIKCSFYPCEECEQQHDYLLVMLKNSLIFLKK